MAKKVAEDWASLLLNDKTFVIVEDGENKASQNLLTGDDTEQHGGVFGASKFWKQGNKVVEKAYALGTAVFYIDLVDPKIEDDTLKADNVRVRYIKDPGHFIPLGYDDDEITECALFSYKAEKGKEYIYLQTMMTDEDEYKISNYYYEKVNDTYLRTGLPEGMADWYKLPCKPFFVLTPNLENNFLDDIPMGVSVYANAVDCLQLCDIAFDNFYTDFYLGRKKIFMDQDMMATEFVVITDNETGKKKQVEVPLAGATLDQSLYVNMGPRLPGENKRYEEYNPTIRVNENKEGIQFALNLLSSKVGFGQNKYQFQMQSMATATQVKVSNKDQTESIWKQRIQVNDLLIEMVRNILTVQRDMCGLPVNPNAKITVKFDDTMFTDEEAERMKDLNDVNAGLMAKWEYRVKWYGEDENTAKKSIQDIDASGRGIEADFKGDE